MRKQLASCAFVFGALVLSEVMWSRSDSASPQLPTSPVPTYKVSFERRDAVAGVSATPVIKLPFVCTSDGTIYVSFVSTVPARAGLPPPPPGPPPTLLASVPPGGRGQTFRLDQIPGLYVSNEVDHYASDSEVIFLVRGSRENKPTKQSYSVGSYQGEFTSNMAEQHLYLVSFSRGGEYRRAVEMGDTLSVQKLAVFPSGALLVSGFDERDYSPRLALLKEDGTVSRFLQIPKGGMPTSMVSAKDAAEPRTVALTELVTMGTSILVIQDKTAFPILEITEGGEIREIRPKLPDGEQVEAAISADRDVYVIAGPVAAVRGSGDVIYEVNPEDGTVVRRFELTDGRTASDVACVHDRKFLSIDYGAGKVVPLVGSPELANTESQTKK